MVWSRWVGDMIWLIYRQYDIKGLKEQQSKLKNICMHELNTHEGIKKEITNNAQMQYFIIQMALENL